MLELFRPEWTGRLHHSQLKTVVADFDALVLSNPLSLRYLTGFDGTSGFLLYGWDRTALVVDGRYEGSARAAQAGGRMAAVELVKAEGSLAGALAQVLAAWRVRRAGFEASHVTVATLGEWQRTSPGVEFVATDRVVERLRVIKDRTEIALMRRAGRVLSGVAGELRRIVRPGRTELEIARAIDQAIERAGFSGPAFPTIVASGANSAYPHARPTSRRLTQGDPVLLDFGGVLDGYCVDLTRMAVIGQPDGQTARLFEAVSEAQRAALAVVKPGVDASAVDAAARDVLESRGLGAAFLHATGHGLGLEVHEAPRVGRSTDASPERLEAGMVLTVEPGAYIDGIGGARLEDDVLVVAGGSELLTDAPRDLLIV